MTTLDQHYADLSDRHGDAHLRDVQAAEDRRERARSATGWTLSESGPAARPLTRGWAMYRRFYSEAELVWVNDLEGNPRALAPNQYRVLQLALSTVEGPRMLTMRQMAAELSIAPSTVSRALARLASWGIIVYLVGRGRFAGLVIIRHVKGDGWEYLRKAAKDRVRRWREAADRRFSRLASNVASIYPRGLMDAHGYGYVYDMGMNATLIAPLTAADVADIENAW